MNSFSDAVNAFEQRCEMHVCFHDYCGELKSFLPSKRLMHNNSYCDHMKPDHFGECTDLDVSRVPNLLCRFPEGFFKICHAYLLEIVLPLRKAGTVRGVIFVGIFRVEDIAMLDGIANSVIDGNCRKNTPIVPDYLKKYPVLTRDEAEEVWELAKALELRLESVMSQENELVFDSYEKKLKWEIENFVRNNCTKGIGLDELAKHVCLSRSRTGELTGKLTGMSFPELLNFYRIAFAKHLLRTSALPIYEVSARAGFSDPSYFHRVFSKLEKISAAAFKKNKKSPLISEP